MGPSMTRPHRESARAEGDQVMIAPRDARKVTWLRRQLEGWVSHDD